MSIIQPIFKFHLLCTSYCSWCTHKPVPIEHLPSLPTYWPTQLLSKLLFKEGGRTWVLTGSKAFWKPMVKAMVPHSHMLLYVLASVSKAKINF